MRGTNADSSGPSALGFSRTKCIRNKRKLRADPSLRLPVSRAGNVISQTLLPTGNNSVGSMDSQACSFGVPLMDSVIKDDGMSSVSARPQFCTPLIFQEHLRLMRWFRTGQFRLSYAMAMGNTGGGQSQEIANYCDGYSVEEIQELHEAHWDENDEAELEGLLLKNLDYVYNEAANRITSYGFSAEEALNALLRNGRCFGSKDVFSNILENAMAYLNSKDWGSYGRDVGFTDLKQLGKHSVADMVCVLRQLRSSLSKGDAMWCLLMCDMNVVQASAMEEVDMAPFSERPSPGLSTFALSQNMGNPVLSASVPVTINPPCHMRMMPQAPTPVQPQVGMFLQAGYAVNPIPAAGTAAPSVDATVQQCGVERTVTESSSKTFSGKLENLVSLSDSCGENIASSNTMHNTVLEEGLKSLHNNVGECALGMSQNIDRLQQLSLNTSLTLKTHPYNITGRDIGVAQSMSSGSSGALPLDVGSGAFAPNNSTVELTFSQSNASASLLGSNLPDTDAKLDMSMQLAVALSEQFQGTSLSAHHNDKSAATASAPITELSLAISSVVDGRSEHQCQDFQINQGMKVCSLNGDVQTSSAEDYVTEDSSTRKDEMLLKLFHRVRELEVLAQERKEWAHQKAMQAACRFSKDMSELKALRLEREEILRLKKDKQVLEESTMKRLTEMETELRKASAQVDRANSAVRKLEIENAEIRAEMEAAKLSAAESEATRQEVTKREKKSMKRVQAWEKQKSKLLKEVASEKSKLAELHQQLSQVKEQQHQAELSWRQEEKAKDRAILLAEAERRAKEQIEAVAKRKEDTLRGKAKADFQRYKDDIKWLESEYAQLRMVVEASQIPAAGSGSGGLTSSLSTDSCNLQALKDANARLFRELGELQEARRDIRHFHDRECIMCMSEEMSVVFLPCAHQVVCSQCNDLHEKQGMKDCPSCRTPIQQRIRVFGVNS